MNNPLLSICIPTYNRAEELKICLESICRQLDANPYLAKDVEIVISDNGSPDHTEKTAQQWQQKYPQIHYVKQESNVGFDKNVLRIIEESHGKYCLTLGDDDAILDDGLMKIIDLLKKNQSSYINLNHWGYNHELTAPLTPHPNREQIADLSYSTLKDYVLTIKSPMQLVGTFGGMSTQLFKRQPWVEQSDKEQFIGTNTIHLFVILSAFKELPSLFMKEATIITRADNLRWDSFPGLETEKKRAQKTIETAIWIARLYGHQMSPAKIRLILTLRAISNVIKGWIKKILYRFGWRKQQTKV